MSHPTVKPIHCSRCGAPLTIPSGQPFVTCGYCQQSHSVLAPPAAPTVGAAFRVGDYVAVEWGGSWWPATILKAQPDGTYRVHYEGWDSRWEEDVPSTRVGSRQAVSPRGADPPRAPAGAANMGWIAFVAVLVTAIGAILLVGLKQGGSRTAPHGANQTAQQSGSQTTANAKCAASNRAYANGDAVQIEWHGTWWPGRVVGVEGGGRYRINYDGYSSSWDETVGPDRLCPK